MTLGGRWSRPTWALHVLIVGLAVHNLVMSLLWRAGLHGAALSAVASVEGRAAPRCARPRRASEATRAARDPGRPARPRIRGDRRRVRLDTAVRARRRCDAQRRSLRGAARPVAGRRVLRRARPRPDRRRARAPLQDGARDRGVRRRLRPARRLPRLARLVASRRRVVCRPARAHVSRPLEPAGELHLQPRERRHLPQAHLDVPLAARDRVPARRRALFPAASQSPPRRAARSPSLRGAPLDAHARRGARARRRAARARGLPPPAAAAAARRARRTHEHGVLLDVYALRAARALHRGRVARAAAERKDASRRRERPVQRKRLLDARSTCRTSAPARGPRSTTRGASGSATPA